MSGRRSSTTVLALAVSLLAASGLSCETPKTRPVEVHAEPLLDRSRPLDRLHLDAAFALDADDRAFGGFSGIAVAADGSALMAVSDRGHWLRLELVHDTAHRLVGVGSAAMGPLRDLSGEPVSGRKQVDAEELVDLGNAWLVAFEGGHRLWRYEKHPPSTGIVSLPSVEPHPRGMRHADDNGGMEAVTALADGRLLMLTESLRVPAGMRGWIGGFGRRWRPLALATTDTFNPTGLARLPNGDVLLLERSYAPETGVRVRLSRLANRTLRSGARLSPEELARLGPDGPVDNFEAVTVHAPGDGTIRIYLLSDDNYSSAQRTLLLQLTLDPL